VRGRTKSSASCLCERRWAALGEGDERLGRVTMSSSRGCTKYKVKNEITGEGGWKGADHHCKLFERAQKGACIDQIFGGPRFKPHNSCSGHSPWPRGQFILAYRPLGAALPLCCGQSASSMRMIWQAKNRLIGFCPPCDANVWICCTARPRVLCSTRRLNARWAGHLCGWITWNHINVSRCPP